MNKILVLTLFNISLLFGFTPQENLMKSINFADLLLFKDSLNNGANLDYKNTFGQELQEIMEEKILLGNLSSKEELNLVEMIKILKEYKNKPKLEKNINKIAVFEEETPLKLPPFFEKLNNKYTVVGHSIYSGLNTVILYTEPTNLIPDFNNKTIEGFLNQFKTKSTITIEMEDKYLNHIKEKYLSDDSFFTAVFKYTKKLSIKNNNNTLYIDKNPKSFKLNYYNSQISQTLFEKSLTNVIKNIFATNKDINEAILNREPKEEQTYLEINEQGKVIKHNTDLVKITFQNNEIYFDFLNLIQDFGIKLQENNYKKQTTSNTNETLNQIRQNGIYSLSCVLKEPYTILGVFSDDNFDLNTMCKEIRVNQTIIDQKDLSI